MTAKRIVVIGGGVSGLAAAHHALELGRARGEEPTVTLLESSDRLGGALGTEAFGGFLMERGADGFLTEKPEPIALAKRLGIDGRIVSTRPARDGAYIVKGGALHPIPAGFSMMAPVRALPFLRSPLLSWRGKARALAEVLVPKRPPPGDESLASFVRRRFGAELLDQLAQPLVSGIYGADPEELSLLATMPRFLQEERRSGSVTLGLRERARRGAALAQGARYTLFASFDGGMQVLVDALAAALGPDRVRLGAADVAIAREGDHLRVRSTAGMVEADHVILAVQGPSLSGLLRPLDGSLADDIAAIRHGSCATVVLGYDARVLPSSLDGYGFVVPAIEGRASMAATFLSRKWPGRADDGKDLVRVFLHWRPEMTDWDDARFVEIARAELRAILGVGAAPVVSRVRRWREAMPQYRVGHVDRAKAMAARAALLPGIHLAGNSLFGVGIPDAIRAGETAARRAIGDART